MKANSNNPKAVSGIMRNLFLGMSVAVAAIFSSCSKEESVNPSQVANVTSGASSNQRQGVSTQVTDSKAGNFSIQQFIGNEWRLILSFESAGAGIDPLAMQAVTKFVEIYQNHLGRQILYQSAYIGREGELEMRFHLREIDGEAQVEFVAELKQVLRGHPSVKVLENAVRLPK